MAKDPALLESHYSWSLTIGGRTFKVDKGAGGNPTVNVVKTVLGDDGDMTATLPGRRDHDDTTFSVKVRASQGVEFERFLLGQTGSTVSGVRYASDGNYSPGGAPLTYTGGVLSKVDPPAYDNESQTVAMIGMTVVGMRVQ